MECQIYWGISKTFRFYKNVQCRLNKNPFRLFNSTERVKIGGIRKADSDAILLGLVGMVDLQSVEDEDGRRLPMSRFRFNSNDNVAD